MGFKNNITQTVQKAIKAYLVAQAFAWDYAEVDPPVEGLEPPVYTSILGETATAPNILVKCQRAHCEVTTEGSWKARARVEIRENADDVTEDEHFEHAGEVFSVFATATIADDLSAALADFTAFLVVRVEQGWNVDGRLWVSYLDLEIDCCGSDIS